MYVRIKKNLQTIIESSHHRIYRYIHIRLFDELSIKIWKASLLKSSNATLKMKGPQPSQISMKLHIAQDPFNVVS